MQPRGRHRAPSKLSTSFNTTARVSAAVAVGGGLVASAVFSQSAQAADTKHQGPASAAAPAQASMTLVQNTARTSAPHVAAAVDAHTRLVAVHADTYVAPVVKKAALAPVRHVVAPVRHAVAPVRHAVSQPAPKHTTPVRSANGGGSTVSAPSSASGVVAIAERYIGVPYVYGGTTPSGFDCSGFTSYVYAQLGINLPRTAAAQQASATPVSTPQPGDLVFFGSPAYHVGIYLGNGMMIAAPKPGDHVKIEAVYGTPSGYGRP
ncbi:C40 family peptidase [Allobranchiibius sp. GilTou38]|uniref:C40 family peptidase n=1 Tax=Allobranchiibius sp. GilTou38 TaxID=2815210 RepID=UPI001FB5ED68|nr:C40 family peptidase [Allobranchiibius sp. GilTou38]